jgi:hypothetical protein
MNTPTDLIGWITYLFKHYRNAAPPDVFDYALYERELQGVPLSLLGEAIRYAFHAHPSFVPNLGELLECIRAVRPEPKPFTPCKKCKQVTPGWVTVRKAGVSRLARCQCWIVWRQVNGLVISAKPTIEKVHHNYSGGYNAQADGAEVGEAEEREQRDNVTPFRRRASGAK